MRKLLIVLGIVLIFYILLSVASFTFGGGSFSADFAAFKVKYFNIENACDDSQLSTREKSRCYYLSANSIQDCDKLKTLSNDVYSSSGDLLNLIYWCYTKNITKNEPTTNICERLEEANKFFCNTEGVKARKDLSDGCWEIANFNTGQCQSEFR